MYDKLNLKFRYNIQWETSAACPVKQSPVELIGNSYNDPISGELITFFRDKTYLVTGDVRISEKNSIFYKYLINLDNKIDFTFIKDHKNLGKVFNLS